MNENFDYYTTNFIDAKASMAKYFPCKKNPSMSPMISLDAGQSQHHFFHCYTDYSGDFPMVGAILYLKESSENPEVKLENIDLRIINSEGQDMNGLIARDLSKKEVSIKISSPYRGDFFVEIFGVNFDSTINYIIELYAFVYL